MEETYQFNGSAVAFGAVLKQGGETRVIPSQASVALVPTGGLGSSIVDNFSQEGISFTRAESRVFGTEYRPGVYTTSVDVYITNLSVKGKLRIALMSATISSTHDTNVGESHFKIHTSYRGIQLEEGEVVPEYDFDLIEAPTYDDVRQRLSSDIPGYSRRWALSEQRIQLAVNDPNPQEPIGGSLIRDLKVPGNVQKHCGHVIGIPGLGKAHFGEFLYKPGRRRFNLLRVTLGASDDVVVRQAAVMAGGDGGFGGTFTAGSVEGNGTPPVGG